MNTHRKIALGTAALIVGSLAFVSSTPSSAAPPTRFDVCPAILSQRICDLLRAPATRTKVSTARHTSPLLLSEPHW